ncbi:YcxB family protein [Aestuariivivens marinum]|uniref:YcxB family protein n=1 Tax=Aestuariivivens marinum TaxID=2913555 RepID=UPI001F599AD2|nr:YcxB family protein [Aestuariivivens marinum]
MTQTKPYSLTKGIYTKIILLKRLKAYWWLYIIMFFLGLFHLQAFGQDKLTDFLAIFLLIYPISVFVYLYFWTNSKGHNPIFKEMNLSFDDSFLYFKREDSESKLNPKIIKKIISKSDYWLLYISKAQFIYIPKHIFNSNEDLESFSNVIGDKM